ncbi:MAG: FtsX-like permease family protein [Candidatus Cloacimonetes bacterium]|nr:FtsX-like permease family protein [Candidatus Cloacimonadota bacterium]
MKIRQIVIKELFQRRNQLISSLIAVSLGIAVMVAIQSITYYSEKAVAGELDALGANVLILAKDATVQDYYSADFQQSEIPEDYVTILAESDIQGIDNMSPKFSLPIDLNGRQATLTGILPKNEFKSKYIWQGALGIFSQPEGCGTPVNIPGVTYAAETTVRRQVIEDLSPLEMLAGADIAKILGIAENDSLVVLGKKFIIIAVLPLTGTVDDGRLFAHLHTVQELAGKSDVLHSIEIVGCCSAISGGLIQKINKLLPDAKVVTITQIVQTQIKTNTVMKRISIILLIVILLVGGASIANYMFSNVQERQREIGIYLALGANQYWIIRMFLMKALIIGISGGIIGYLLGSVLAIILGPQIAGINVLPLPWYAVYSLLISVIIALIASAIPALKAAKVDPSIIMKEI